MPPDLEIETASPEETQRVARAIGERCTGGEVVFLVGPLGAGKTCFTQGLAWGAGVEEYTHSPTFVMVTEYSGRLPFYHVDLYRTESIDEAWELGLEEYMSGEGVCAIEWGDKVLPFLHQRGERQGLLVELAYVDGQRRRITLRPWDARSEALVERGREALSEPAR